MYFQLYSLLLQHLSYRSTFDKLLQGQTSKKIPADDELISLHAPATHRGKTQLERKESTTRRSAKWQFCSRTHYSTDNVVHRRLALILHKYTLMDNR